MKIEVKKTFKRVDYIESMKKLEKRVNDVLLGKKNELLWIIEHNHVYTSGSKSKDSELLNKNIKVIRTNRGGKYTYHGPGQKVIYFALNLNKREKDIKKLLMKVEQCIILILKEFKINAFADRKNIGIWVKHKNKTKKIAAIGIKVKKWIAYHGFSLNLSTDLTKFNAIVPCGIKDKEVTSMKELGVNKFNNVNEIIIKHFLNIFA